MLNQSESRPRNAFQAPQRPTKTDIKPQTQMFDKHKIVCLGGQNAGEIVINRHTLKQVRTTLQQSMKSNNNEKDFIKSSIFHKGYMPILPIVFDSSMRNIKEGWMRVTSCIELVEEGEYEEFVIPFVTSDVPSVYFNTGTRGATESDISWILNRPEWGNGERAVKQSIEACKILSTDKLPFNKAFKCNETQKHISKITYLDKMFVNALSTTANVIKESGHKVDRCQLSYLIAFFIRCGINERTIKLASTEITLNEDKGTQRDRLNLYKKLCYRNEKLNAF